MRKGLFCRRSPSVNDVLSNLKPKSLVLKQALEESTQEDIYVYVPERYYELDTFIGAAKVFAGFEHTSIEIVKGDYEVNAIIDMESICLSGYAKDLLAYLLRMSDDVNYLPKDGDLKLRLTYYTHELFRNGKKVRNIY